MSAKRAYISIGSNLANPRRQVQQAIIELEQLAQCQLIAGSKLYETKPVGYLEQPNFINAVVALDTELTAHNLLAELQKLEQAHGRIRTGIRFGPRTLDLDLLLFEREVINDKYLQVPHPRMLERDFVLKPLAEVTEDYAGLMEFLRKVLRRER